MCLQLWYEHVCSSCNVLVARYQRWSSHSLLTGMTTGTLQARSVLATWQECSTRGLLVGLLSLMWLAMDEYCKKGFIRWFATSAKENVNIDDAIHLLVANLSISSITTSTSSTLQQNTEGMVEVLCSSITWDCRLNDNKPGKCEHCQTKIVGGKSLKHNTDLHNTSTQELWSPNLHYLCEAQASEVCPHNSPFLPTTSFLFFFFWDCTCTWDCAGTQDHAHTWAIISTLCPGQVILQCCQEAVDPHWEWCREELLHRTVQSHWPTRRFQRAHSSHLHACKTKRNCPKAAEAPQWLWWRRWPHWSPQWEWGQGRASWWWEWGQADEEGYGWQWLLFDIYFPMQNHCHPTCLFCASKMKDELSAVTDSRKLTNTVAKPS